MDTDLLFEEFHRILVPGGYLCITTTDFNWLEKALIAALVFDRYFFPTNPHIRFYTRSTLSSVLSQHGFELVKHAWNGSYYGLMPKGQMVLARKKKP